MRHFGPPHTPGRVDGMEPDLRGIVTRLIDDFAGRNQVDIVDDFAYPFPVTVICELLGVPREDEPRFHVWVEAGLESLDPKAASPEQQQKSAQAMRGDGPVPHRAHRGPTAGHRATTCSPRWPPTTAPTGG